MSAPQLFQDVGPRTLGHQLLTIPGRSNSDPTMDMTGAHRLIWIVALGRILARGIRPRGSVGAGGKAGKIKPMVEGSGEKRLAEVCVFPAGGWLAIALAVTQSDMPFTYHASGIAGSLQHRGDGWPVCFNQGISLGTKKNPPPAKARSQRLVRRAQTNVPSPGHMSLDRGFSW